MTPEEIERLRREEPKRFNVFVAIDVMGWTEPRIGTEDVPPFPLKDREWSYNNPPSIVEEWRSNYHWRDRGGACWREPHDFSEPRRDYEVLKHVRETWADREKRLFLNRLYEIQSRDLSRWPEVACELVYLPGDYSEGALRVAAALSVVPSPETETRCPEAPETQERR